MAVSAGTAHAQQAADEVTVVGEMRNVMWKGELEGTIRLDTISQRADLYGLGPVEFLSGEILILDGVAYKSTVDTDSTMTVEQTYEMAAPFFGYANVGSWSARPLPDSVLTLGQLELYLNGITQSSPRPFLFRLSGTVEEATIHVVNLPEGSEVRSPAQAHVGQRDYQLRGEPAEMLGFFSTDHKAIFTHHDTYLHVHLITSDRRQMGHLDAVRFQKGTMTLYLPASEGVGGSRGR